MLHGTLAIGTGRLAFVSRHRHSQLILSKAFILDLEGLETLKLL